MTYAQKRKRECTMIYTLTCNPSLDQLVTVDYFEPGELNRTSAQRLVPGGKGINVSLVLKNLGIDSMALGFVAGKTGEMIEELLADKGVKTDFVRLPEGMSRINIKIKSQGCETEINGQGPYVSAQARMALFQKLDRLRTGDILVLSGSISEGLSNTLYEDILARLAEKELKIIVDATGELLMRACRMHPFFVKPNKDELAQLFDVQIATLEDAAKYGRRLLSMGPENVLVSMGRDGAVLLTGDGLTYAARPPKGEVICTVGAGDSMVAGFLAGYLASCDMQQAFLYGICAGSASAYAEGMADVRQVARLLQEVRLCDSGGNPDEEEIIRMLDAYARAGGSRMKVEVTDALPEGAVKRQYHHGRCDVGSPWACGAAFDVLE